MLSVFITPWMKPRFIHCASSPPGSKPPPLQKSAPGVPASAGSWRAIDNSRPAAATMLAAGRGVRKLPRAGDCRVIRAVTRRRAAGGRAALAGRWPRPASGWSGMPSAHGLADHVLRSIGPTAASLSPLRANGVRPNPLRTSRNRPAASAIRRAAVRGPSPRGAGRSRRTGGSGVGLRDRDRAGRHVVADRKRSLSGPRSQAGSSPRSAASASLSSSSSGSAGTSACHGTASSGSARLKRSCRTTVVSGATLT